MMLAPLAANAEEAVGSMGNDTAARRPVRAPPAPLLVLQAAVRAGHESADRLDPRGGRDERADAGRLRAQPARRDARARAPARDREPDPRGRPARAATRGGVRRVPGGDRSTQRGRRPRGPTGSRPRSIASARRRTPRSRTARTSWCSPTVRSARSASRCRRCSPRRRSTTTSFAPGRACRRGWWSSRASRAACRASPCSSATARRP